MVMRNTACSIAPTDPFRILGAIIQLYILGKSIIILNDAEDAHTLLDKRGFNYSDRPDSTLFGKMCDRSLSPFILECPSLSISVASGWSTSQPSLATVMISEHSVASRHST